VRQLCKLINDNIISRMHSESYILINDINHNSARDCFDILLRGIRTNKIVKRYRFHEPTNVSYENTRSYENRGNKTVRNVPKLYQTQMFINNYNPRTICSSAQVTIEMKKL
jgi:hypothetical protein